MLEDNDQINFKNDCNELDNFTIYRNGDLMMKHHQYISYVFNFYKNKDQVIWNMKSIQDEIKCFIISRNDKIITGGPFSSFVENGMRISFSVDDPNLYIKFSNWYYIFEDIYDKEFDIKFTTQIENDKNIDILDIDINSDSIKWSKNRNYFNR